LRQFQLHCVDAVCRVAIVTRDMAAFEAAIDDEAVIALRLQHVKQTLLQLR
jgi:hypothetical protein